MAKNEKKKLEETKGSFEIKGILKGLDRDNAWTEDILDDSRNKNDGKNYRELIFNVATHKNNSLRFKMRAYEPDKVMLWDSKTKGLDKEKRKSYVDYEKYSLNKERYRKEGKTVIGQSLRVGFDYDDKGKLISHNEPLWDALEMIKDEMGNGESVYLQGDINYFSFEDRDSGEEVSMHSLKPTAFIVAKDEFDFDDEEFREKTRFVQPMIFTGATPSPKEKKTYVQAKIVGFTNEATNYQFVVDYSDDDPAMEKLAKSVAKIIKFGDVITTHGDILNRAIPKSGDDEESDDELLSSLGGRKERDDVSAGRVTYDYYNAMSIEGISELQRKVYKLEDFEQKEDKEDLTEEFGGRSNDDGEDDPFANDDDAIDISDDDLPF